MISILFFLSSGLFLGWSLGANHAGNVFGTAVGTKMVKFETAAIFCSIFVILGSVISGAGASNTLGRLGSVNAIAGSFTVALSVGISVFAMTKAKIPVSTSQAIVGAIIGWNFFAGVRTDFRSLTEIISSWVICPILTAAFSMVFYFIAKYIIENSKIHILRLDHLTRIGLIVVGSFGSYSLGANNIANVMGVFVPVSPFKDINIGNLFVLTNVQQLFLLGGISIAVGVFTYSKKVMETIGGDIFKLSPVTGFIAVLSTSIVLFLFSSQGLKDFLTSHKLPSLPLVPVSSSQAIVGAVLGIGMAKCRQNIKFGIIGKISSGWIIAPIVSALLSFVMLFIVQNVFMQEVYKKLSYSVTNIVIKKLTEKNLPIPENFSKLQGKEFRNAIFLNEKLKELKITDKETIDIIFKYSEKGNFYVNEEIVFANNFGNRILSPEQIEALRALVGRKFDFRWQFEEALQKNDAWKYKKEITIEDKKYNKSLDAKYKYIFNTLNNTSREK